MIVIFLGPDRVGKDTQIKEVRSYFENHPFHVLYYPAIKSNNCKEYSIKIFHDLFKLFKMSTDNDINLICNRSYLDELVYAPLYRDYDVSDIWKMEENESLSKYWDNVYLIYLRNDIDVLLEREDGYSITNDRKNKAKEMDRFDFIYEQSLIKHKMMLNCYNLTKEETTYKIVQFLRCDKGHETVF
jgi:thymidylate kinase